MSVVQITKACSLSCTYCFDKVWQDEAKTKKNVTIDSKTFDNYLSRMWEFFQSKPEEKNICISWGEPTLHPLFKKFVNKSIHSWFDIYLLSNFTFSTDIANFLKWYFRRGNIKTMVNVNSPYWTYAWMNKFLWTRTLINLKILESEDIRLSFNIFDPDEKYDFVYEVLEKYPNLDKTIRLWVVNPIISDLRKDDTFVFDKTIKAWKKESTWSFYQRLWKVTDELVDRLTKKWYKIYLDCWVWWCIFNNKTIWLIENNWWKIHWCSLPNDEVSIWGTYSSCYTLHDYWNEDWKLNIDNHSIKKSRWKFILKTELFKEHYLILPKCIVCPLLKQGCPRFCVSNNIPYYEKLFSNWFNDLIEDEYYSKLTKEVKDFTRIEYMISKNLQNEYHLEIDNNKNKEKIKKLQYDKNISIRYYLYDIIMKYLSNFDRKEGLSSINIIMSQVSKEKVKLNKKDFALLRIFEILIKEYKKI